MRLILIFSLFVIYIQAGTLTPEYFLGKDISPERVAETARFSSQNTFNPGELVIYKGWGILKYAVIICRVEADLYQIRLNPYGLSRICSLSRIGKFCL